MISKASFTSKSDEWETPDDLFNELDAEFHFNLDPCATRENHKCEWFITKDGDGLSQCWGGAQSLLQPAV